MMVLVSGIFRKMEEILSRKPRSPTRGSTRDFYGATRRNPAHPTEGVARVENSELLCEEIMDGEASFQ